MKTVIEIDRLKLSIQGIEGCFHHVAAKAYFKEGFDIFLRSLLMTHYRSSEVGKQILL